MAMFPTDFTATIWPLTADFDEVTNEAIQSLQQRDYVILVGLTPELHKDILAMASEEHIREYCPRDCSLERFANEQSTRRWLAAGHAFFTLMKKTSTGQQPVGYGWSGPKTTEQVPGGQTTFAVRVAQAGLGQKLSEPFSQVIIGVTAKLYEARKFWLETWGSNGGAVHVYEKLGFKLISQQPSERPTVNRGNVSDTRLFMSLAESYK